MALNEREVVNLALQFKPVPYVPWSCGFTIESAEKLKKHFGVEDLNAKLKNHLCMLGKAVGCFEISTKTAYRIISEWFGTVRLIKT